MMPSTRAGLCVGFAAVLLACTADSKSSGNGLATTAPTVVRVPSANYAFQAPDTIMAGWTTLRFANHGDDVHYAHIVRLDSGRTVPERHGPADEHPLSTRWA